MLPAAGRLRRHVQGTDGDGEWENYGDRERQPEVRELHGAQRLRGQRRERHVGSLKGLLETAKAIFFDSYRDDGAMKLLNEWKPAHAAPLVQIEAPVEAVEELCAAGSFGGLTMATVTQEAGKLEQLSHEAPDEIEVAAGREREQLEGWVPALANRRRGARGAGEGVRLSRRHYGDAQGRDAGAGILYDRRTGASLADSLVRIMPADGGGRVKIPYAEIAGLAFTGRDTAAGKTFDAWVKKYWEKKAAGEKNIQIEPEKLD